MRVVRVEARLLGLRLVEPYTIAYETVETVENVLLRVVTDGPHVGLGIAAPDQGVTGERPEACLAALREVVGPRLLGADALRRLKHVETFRDLLPEAPAARAAVDMALLDLLGKRAGLPVWRLLGGYRGSIATSATLFITPPEEAARRGRELVAQGFRALKIKGGRDLNEDIDRVEAVRREVGPAIELRFDANQGYSVDDALRFILATEHLNLSVMEQPTKAHRMPALKAVTQGSHLRIMADESLNSAPDTFRFARNDAMDMVNIKLARVGGVDPAMLMNGVARAAGLEVMVGCVDEAALSIAASLAFALSRRNVEMADLDGHLDLLDDPTACCVTLREGLLYPSEEPGLGLRDLG